MSTFAEIQEKVKARVTGAGVNVNVGNFDATLKAAINWAQREFCTVRWRFLQHSLTFDTVAGQYAYDLFNQETGSYMDFGRPMRVAIEDEFDELISAQASDIIGFGASMEGGLPGFYSFSGVKQAGIEFPYDVPQILIGIPTPDAPYTVRVSYYRRLANLVNNDDVSLVCRIYNDDPLVEGAAFRWALDIGEPADPTLWLRSMQVAQEMLPYDGAPYNEDMRQKDK